MASINPQMAHANTQKDDLTVAPMPGQAAAFAIRLAAMTPAPFAPTTPLTQGKYTLVIIHEKSLEESTKQPTKLRYAFATLDSHGKTQVLSTQDLAHAHLPPQEASFLLQTWEKDSLQVCEDLENDQNRLTKRTAGMTGLRDTRVLTKEDLKPEPDEPCILRLEVSSAAEVDEVFGALGKGRMVGQEI
jgi:hypothetical protein